MDSRVWKRLETKNGSENRKEWTEKAFNGNNEERLEWCLGKEKLVNQPEHDAERKWENIQIFCSQHIRNMVGLKNRQNEH